MLLNIVWGRKDRKGAIGVRQDECKMQTSVWRLLLSWFALCLVVVSTACQPQDNGSEGLRAEESRSELVGAWNISTGSLSQRPTGGQRNMILVVSDVNGELSAKITNLRHNLVPVGEFSYEPESKLIQVRYGAYHFYLELDGDRLEGTIFSPAGEQAARGGRQLAGDFRYRAMDVQPFETTRTGVIGHLSAFQPPEGESDPNRWVLDRIESPDDWAIIVRDNSLSIGFANPTEFESELRRHAGQEVDIHGVWVGERLRILHLTYPSGGGHAH